MFLLQDRKSYAAWPKIGRCQRPTASPGASPGERIAVHEPRRPVAAADKEHGRKATHLEYRGKTLAAACHAGVSDLARRD